MFSRVFIESKISDHQHVANIVERLNVNQVEIIDNYESVFGRVRKPYLHKSKDLAIFLAEKKGELVKPAPQAYGFGSEFPHYYFYHQLNCIFDCQYCYLQGYFSSPDIVLFTNFSDIIDGITKTLNGHPHSEKVWFHAGEFSDSLALSGYFSEWKEFFWPFFAEHPRAFLELRSKSSNIRSIQDLEPLPNVVISFSLSTPKQASFLEAQLPPVEARLRSLSKLAERGFKYGIHLDPIVYYFGLRDDLERLSAEIAQLPHLENLSYISIGCVRFSKNSYREFCRNYPDSVIHGVPMEVRKDGKVSYPDHVRKEILQTTRELLVNHGIPDGVIYDCMEDFAETF